MDITCPSCQYVRKENSHPETPEWRCPACEIVYEKYEKNISKMNELSDVIAERQATEEAVSPSENSTTKPSHDNEPSKLALLISDYLGTFKVMFRDFLTAKGGLIILVVFILGFFTGREYFKYEIRQAVGTAFSGISGKVADTNSTLSNKSIKLPEIFTNTKSFPAFLIKKGYREFNANLGGDAITIDIQITNTFNKKIDGFNGLLIFSDILGNEIKRLNITVTDSIDVGANLLWMGEMDYNQFIDSSRALRNTDREKIRVNLQLKKVIFADGTVEEFD
jgi:hypothetical protein